MKLYELTSQYQSLSALLDDNAASTNEVVKEVLARSLATINEDIQVKAVSIAKMILGYEAEDAILNEEHLRLRARQETLRNKQEWLKGYLLEQMQALGFDKIKDAVVTVAIRMNPPSVEIVDAKLIPEQFTTVVTETRTDKKAILDHFKSTGEMIAGVKMVTDKKRIDIR